jgi:hypothetical protein
MSFSNITTAFVQSYGTDVKMMAQQEASRLYNLIRVEQPNAERHYFELYNSTSGMAAVTNRNGDLAYTESAFERRAVDVIDYEDSILINKFDVQKMLADPVNPIVKGQAANAGRLIDSLINNAALGNMLSGKTGSTTTALPAGQQIAVNSWAYGAGTGNANLTISKILEAKAKMDAAEVPDADRYMVVDGINMTKLLATAEATSKDFVSSANLENGMIANFAGFKFVRSEQLPTDGSGYRRCYAFQGTGLGLAMNQNVTARIDELVGKSGMPYQAYIAMAMAATRLEDAKVVEVKCLAT